MAEFKLGRLKFVWKGQWTASATYVKDDIVRHGGKSYVCVQGHVAGGTLYSDSAKWELMNDGFAWKNVYTPSTYYKINDIVAYGGSSYICTYAHTAGALLNESYFDIFAKGVEVEESWDSEVEYQLGDVVSYGGYTYYALEANSDTVPTSDVEVWRPFVEGINNRGAWVPSGSGIQPYKTGDVVRYGGNSYLCIADATTQLPSDTDYWELFTEGFAWQQNWTSGTPYKLNEAVKFNASTYICIQSHTASSLNSPDVDVDHDYWDTLADGSAAAVVTVQGDMVYRDESGGQRLPIGELGPEHADHDGQLHSVQPILVVNPAGTEPEWSKTAHIGVEAIHVDNHVIVGGDDTEASASASVFIGVDAQSYLVDDSQFEGYVGLTDVKFLAVTDLDGFGQISFKNINSGTSASTDLILYTDDGDNDSGWIDMGITSSSFDITSGFGITGIHDGYIFMNAPVNSSGFGNLVIATSENGTEKDIIFVTGGFDITTNTDAEKMRIIGEPRNGAMFTGEIAGTTLTVTAVSMGTILFDGEHTINGAGLIDGTVIIAQLSGAAGSTGTYTVNKQQTVSSRAMTQDKDAAGVEIYINTAATNPYTGALRVKGGVGIQGDLDLEGTIEAYGGAIYQGTDGAVTARMLTLDNSVSPGYVGLTDASAVFTGHADSFVQMALRNFSDGASASTDVIMYSSNGDNESGWMDMGITSENYNDPTFTVTGPSTGYIFMSAPAGTTSTGNMLVGTSENGTQNDIVFFTDGFDAGNEKLRIVGNTRPGKAAGVEIYADTESTSSTTGALRVEGGIGLQGNLNVGGNVAITGTISIGGSGSSLETTTLAVSDPMIRMGSGNPSDLVDLGFYGTFSSISTLLNGAINASVTTITVDSTTAFPTSGNLVRGSEEMSYTGKTPTTFTGVTRGVNGTTAAVHGDNSPIFIASYAGLVRDASDGAFKLFTNLNTLAPTATVDFGLATLAAFSAGAITSTGAGSFAGDIAVNGGDLTSTATTFNFLNSTVETLNIGGAASTIALGASNSTLTLGGNLTVNGITTVESITEIMDAKASATGTVTHDFNTSDVFYHTGISANFTANITNMPTTVGRISTVTLILAQGGTGYLPTAVQINGTGQTIRWAGNTQPTPQANKTDVVVFTLIRTAAGAWVVLGQMSSYG
jgi:hypothetical protein